MDANKKIDLQHPLCPNESKILTNILQNHPLRFNITSSSSVLWIYLRQFWHTLKEYGSKYKLSFVLDKKELTMTLDDFRTIFHLPQATNNNNDHSSLKFSNKVPFYINNLGFTLELRSPSNFKITGFHYLLEHPTTLILYPRFTKLIVSHYMTAFPDISRRAHDKYHNFKDDEMVKSIFNSWKNKARVGLKIPSWMITDEMKLTKNYQTYATVFEVDVLTTQLQPIESTQGTHRTTSAPSTPIPNVQHQVSNRFETPPVESVEDLKMRIEQYFLMTDYSLCEVILNGDSPTPTRVVDGFKDPDYLDKFYKVVKALYGLHQALKAWYETLANYLLKNGFQRGKIDQTLFIKKQKGDILLVQMSSIEELIFFLGLQVKQKGDGIFISQDKYVVEILRKFSLTDGKSASTPIDIEKPLLKDLDDEDVDVHIYRLIITAVSYTLMMFGLTKDDVHLMLLDDLSSHNTKYTSHAPTQKVFANMARIGKGFSRVDTPLFDAMLVQQQVHDDVAEVKEDEDDETCATLTQKVTHLGQDKVAQALEITKLKQRVRKLEKKRKFKSSGLKRLKRGKIAELDADEDITLMDVDAEVEIDTNIQGRMVESQAKAYNLDLQHSKKVFSVQDTDEAEPTKVEKVLEVVTAAKLMTEVVTTAAPITTVAQNDVIEQVKRSEKQDNTVMRYQALKRKPVTEAQARKNMMIYLKNMVGFKMNFFKAKKQRMDEEEEELKRHLQIVANDDDDVYTEATPLASKVLVVGYQIRYENNKPYYKINRADGTHKLFLSFITLLKNFDREDLETLWKLVKERFESTEPKNFSDDFLLNILKIMFEKPNVKANVWRDQKGRYGLAKMKYPLTHFTLEQMLNIVRLKVKEESEMSLELLRLVRRQLNEGYVPE
nr:hypothetical protein [Tanacetum cinerariifolium]